MGFKCGIVGLPNVGKSTLFNALTNANIAAQNYPFCTIEPNTGIVPVPDKRLDKLANIAIPEKIIPTTIEFVDIAGLVKGAAQGEGLGNKFLSHIREADAIAHVVRCFDNDDITHVEGKINPIADLETIITELLLADLDTVEKALNKTRKNAKHDKKIEAIANFLEQLKALLDSGKQAIEHSVHEDMKQVFYELHLLTAKPIMIIANVDEQTLEQGSNVYLDKIKQYASDKKIEVVTICAAIEAELASISIDEQKEFLSNYGMDESGLAKVIQAGYKLLNLQTFFTCGKKEVRAWTIETNSSAPVAAGKIHTDFEKGFIRAEVVSYADFTNFNGFQGAKDAGKWRLEGKEYIVQDGDIMLFRFNV